MMQRSYSRDTSAPHHFSGWSSHRQDCHSRGPHVRGDWTADLPARNVHAKLVNALARCCIGRADFLFIDVLAVPAAPPSGPTAHAAACPFSWGTVRWSRGCRDDGQVPEQSSAFVKLVQL